ncbi:MAG: hypothetical protein JW883_17315 [Deltaproteobacteria bacterium]|nr:hypothetical protein [Deltaproteobacteria bacterium]
MTHEDAGHYARKHGPDAVVDELIRDTLLKRAVDGRLPCAVAFDVAKRLEVTPEAIGRAADLMELRLLKCQLGLFGYHHKKSIVRPSALVSAALEEAIRNALLNERLPCKKAWEIAKTFGVHKMKVSAACDVLEIKISPCQLGAF